MLDLEKVYTNDIHAMANTYGIEAACKAIIKASELYPRGICTPSARSNGGSFIDIDSIVQPCMVSIMANSFQGTDCLLAYANFQLLTNGHPLVASIHNSTIKFAVSQSMWRKVQTIDSKLHQRASMQSFIHTVYHSTFSKEMPTLR